MMMKSILGVLLVVVAPLKTLATVIDFDDGTPGSAVDGFYAAHGVVFEDAQWIFGVGDIPGNSGIHSLSLQAQPRPSDPIVAVFTQPVTSVSITGYDIGQNGVRLDAYDANTGGNLVGFDQAFGIGNGDSNPIVLSVSSASIARVEIYQPINIGGDGLALDNLMFVPEPSPAILVTIGTFGLALYRRLHRRT